MEEAGVMQRVSPERPSLAVATSGAPKLLDRVRQTIRAKHYSRRTESAYVDWIRRYILFHQKRHPSEMGAPEIAAFLTWLATNRRVSASTQNQSLSALLFLYRDVLHIEIGSIENVPRARMPVRVPVVLSRDEVARIMKHLHGVTWIMVTLLYGSGLAARMPGASREGHRCGAAADCDSTRQRPEGPANSIASRRRRAVGSPSRVREATTRSRSRARVGPGRAALRARPQIPERTHRMGLAVRVSRVSGVYGSEMGSTDAVSSARIRRAESGRARGTAGRDREACRSTHFQALIRNTPDRGWPRHQNRPGAARARGRQHDDGVHARAQSRSARRAQSCRPTLMSANAVGGEQWRPIKAHGPCGSTREIVDLQEVGRSKVVARCPSLAATARVQCGRSRPITFVIAVVTAWYDPRPQRHPVGVRRSDRRVWTRDV
jgi:Phage integrase, N-terminal SAM-like domain